MIKLRLKPHEELKEHLATMYDIVNDTTRIGTNFIPYSEDLESKELWSLDTTEYSSELDSYFLIVKDEETNKRYYVHHLWVKSIIVEEEEQEIVITNSVFLHKNIVTKTPKRFFDLSINSFVPLDTACTSCGSVDRIELFIEGLCPSCVDKTLAPKDYSYHPTPKFEGTSENEAFYGIEIELPFKSKEHALRLLLKGKDRIYLKKDASISGGGFPREVVSHPYSFDAWMDESSWIHHLSEEMVSEHPSCGIHIHINRKTFKTNKHYSLFYFLFHNSERFISIIGRRKPNTFCSYSPLGEVYSKANTVESHNRHSAINENNASTVEVRVFNSSATPSIIRSYIQLVDALVEYTRTAKKSVSLKGLIGFILKDKKYADLAERVENEVDFGLITPSTVTYRAPVIKQYVLEKLSLDDLSKVFEITGEDGTVYSIVKGRHVRAESRVMYFYYTRKDNSNVESKSLPFSAISQVKVKK